MSTEVEDRVRETLHLQAREIEVRGPSAEGVFKRVRERRIRRRTTRAVAATLAVAVVVVGLGALSRGSTSTVQTGRANQPVLVALGHPAMITLDGWAVTYVAVVEGYTEYHFTDGTRTLQVDFYELGSRTGNETNPTEVALRGTTGVTTDEVAPRYRVDWDEQGQTWEADGEPFASVSEFLSTLEQLRVLDEATWKASLPDGVGDAILSNPDRNIAWDKSVTWGASCFGSQGPEPCN